MNRNTKWGWVMALTGWLLAAELPAQEPTQDGAVDFEEVIANARAGGARRRGPSQFRDFNEVTKGAEKVDGLFTLYKNRRPPVRRDSPGPVQPDAARSGDDRPRPGPGRPPGRR